MSHQFRQLPALAARTLLALPLAALLVDLIAPPAAAAVIELKERSEATAAVICLKDVAWLHDEDPARRERLAGLVLAPAPAPGRSIELDFETIRARLAALGINLAEHEFKGSSRVWVQATTSETGSLRESAGDERVQRRLEDQLSRAVARKVRECAPEAGAVAVKLALSRPQLARLGGAASAKLEVTGGAAPYMGDQLFRVAWADALGVVQSLELACRVEPLPLVVAARRNVPRGAVLSASDVELRQLEAGEENLAGTCLTSLDQALGRETKRVLRAGAPVPAADLRSVPLIRRGDLVTVRARSNGVVVRMDAKAHGDGSRGETVKLVTLDGRRELFARVVGFHEAEVAAPAQATTLGSGPMVRFMPAAAASQPLDEPRGAAPGGLQGPEGAPRAALAPLATAKRQAAQQTVDQKTHLAEP